MLILTTHNKLQFREISFSECSAPKSGAHASLSALHAKENARAEAKGIDATTTWNINNFWTTPQHSLTFTISFAQLQMSAAVAAAFSNTIR
jgi:hypothetical protein